MTHLLTGTASLAAVVALGLCRSRRHAVAALACFASLMFLATLFRPDLWTPETFCASEGALAVLAVVVGLAAARRAGTAPDALAQAFFLAAAAGVAGWIALHFVPLQRNFAYRGLVFLDLAVVAVLATIAARSELVDRTDSIAVRWLALAFALSSLRLLMFEFHFGLGRLLGWLQTFAWIAGMLLIAREAIAPRRGPSL